MDSASDSEIAAFLNEVLTPTARDLFELESKEKELNEDLERIRKERIAREHAERDRADKERADDNTPNDDPWVDVCIEMEQALKDAQAQGCTERRNQGPSMQYYTMLLPLNDALLTAVISETILTPHHRSLTHHLIPRTTERYVNVPLPAVSPTCTASAR